METTQKGCARSAGIQVRRFDNSANGDSGKDVKNIVLAGWNRWRKMTGILC